MQSSLATTTSTSLTLIKGDVPVSLAEFTLDAGDGHTYYDISLVDGYNLPMAIVLHPLGNQSLDDLPPNLTNPSCVGTIGHLEPKNFDAYSSDAPFLRTNKTYPLPFERKVTDKDVSHWCPWDLLQYPPSIAGAGDHVTYPDNEIVRPVFSPCLSDCAKKNKPKDCCTGKYGTSSSCKPSKYSKKVKKICPDAYSYGKNTVISRNM